MKALFTYNYGKDNMDKIRNLGYEIVQKNGENISYTEEIEDVEVLVCYNPFNKLDINKMKNLKWIQLASIGVDQVPNSTVLENNIILTNNKGGYSVPMGECYLMVN